MSNMKKEVEDEGLIKRKDLGWFVVITAVVLSVFHIYTAGTEPFYDIIQRSIHLGLSLMLCFAARRLKPSQALKQRWQMILFDIVVNRIPIFFAFVIMVYVLIHGKRMIFSPWDSTPLSRFLGAILILLILEACRRLVGLVLASVAIMALLYTYFGPYFPGLLTHKGFSIKYIIEQMFLSMSGIWGIAVRVSANVIAIFVIFGAVLLMTGGARGFIDLAMWVAGRYRGGAAKVAAIASAMFGSISGSAVANVATTGNFTIPLMKRLGYQPEQAAGIEAAASTGGQIMPPVMGAGAFVMAELLNIPYLAIIKVALLPAVIYFVCVLFGIHFESLRTGLKPVPREMVPKTKQVISGRNLPLFIPLGVFVFYLVAGVSPERSVFRALVVAMILFAFSDLSLSNIRKRICRLFDGLIQGAITIVSVAVLNSTAQIVVCVFGLTGVGVKVTQMIVSASGGILLIALFLAMVSAVFLGMGIPTTAAYILVAAAVAPALGALGLPMLSVHLFLFYFACLSTITPPVCGSVYVASAMAGANWFKTATISMKLALAGIIVPYLFILNPELMLVGQWGEIILAIGTAFFGTMALAIAATGFFVRPLLWPLRLLIGGASLLVISSGIISDIIGIVLILALLGTEYLLLHKGRRKVIC